MENIKKPDFTLTDSQLTLLNETIYYGINQHFVIDWGTNFGPPIINAGFGYSDSTGSKLLLKMRQYSESNDGYFDHYDIWFEAGKNNNSERCLSVRYLPSVRDLGKYSTSGNHDRFNAFVGRIESFGYVPRMDVFLPLGINCIDENGDTYIIDPRPYIELIFNKDTGERIVKKHFSAVGYIGETFGKSSGLYLATKDNNTPVNILKLTPINKKANISANYILTSGSWGDEQFTVSSAEESILHETLFKNATDRFENLAWSLEILAESFVGGKKKGNILERTPDNIHNN